jgi:hypothetical protein
LVRDAWQCSWKTVTASAPHVTASCAYTFCEYKREGDTRMLVICGSCCKARYGGHTSDVVEVHRWSDLVLTHLLSL